MVTPYGRSREFYDPLSEMNRLFDEAFGDAVARRRGHERAQAAQGAEWAPAIDVVQQDVDLVVRAELPGARPEDVKITFQDGVLTIGGKIHDERGEQRGGYLIRERRSGSFRRSLQLPEGVDEDKIRARFENGVLEVTLQGVAAARGPRRVQIEGGQGPEGGQDVEGTGGGGSSGRRVPEGKSSGG